VHSRTQSRRARGRYAAPRAVGPRSDCRVRRLTARARHTDRLGGDRPAGVEVRRAARPSVGEAGSLVRIGGEPRGSLGRPGASAARISSQVHRADLAVRDRREFSALSSRSPDRRCGAIPRGRLRRADARGCAGSVGRGETRDRGDC
jgi:hypothetical protein